MPKPKIKKVKFNVDLSQQSILSDTGMVLSDTRGTGFIEAPSIIDPSTVGVRRVMVHVDNGWGTDDEIVTLNIYDPYTPKLNGATVNAIQNAPITLTPTGQFITTGGNIQVLSWSVTDLPAGMTLDPATGVLSGAIASVGTVRCKLTITTNHGTDTALIEFVMGSAMPVSIFRQILYPARLTGQYNIDRGGIAYSNNLVWQSHVPAIITWRVRPAGGTFAITGKKEWTYSNKYKGAIGRYNLRMGTMQNNTPDYSEMVCNIYGTVLDEANRNNGIANVKTWPASFSYTVNGNTISQSFDLLLGYNCPTNQGDKYKWDVR